jgi:hypothetical protein
MIDDVESFRAVLDPDVLQTVDAVRSLVRQSHPGLTERIKWNAPSFALGDEDRITLGLERNGGIRVVLHRGVKKQAVEGFSFNDPAGLAKWPASDRGVVIFQSKTDVAMRASAFTDLCSRWLEATS